MTDTAWDETRDRLTSELGTLEDGEFVVLGEPVTYGEPGGLFRRKPKPIPGRYVQFLRMKDLISGECVGATAFGGDLEMTPEQQDRIRELGWHAPGEMPDTDPGYPNFRCDLPLDQAPRLAEMGVAALDVLGLGPEDPLELRRDS